MDPLPVETGGDPPPKAKVKDMSKETCQQVLHYLLERFDGHHLQRGALAEAARLAGVTRSAVSKRWQVWRQRKEMSLSNSWDISSRKSTNGGHNKKPRHELVQVLRDVPLSSRRTLRDAATAVGNVSHTTLHRMVRMEGKIRKGKIQKYYLVENETEPESIGTTGGKRERKCNSLD